MTKHEAILAMVEGKKVVLTGGSYKYVHYTEKGGFAYNCGTIFNTNHMIEGNWQLYLEKVDYFTAINAILDGDKAECLFDNKIYHLYDRIIVSDKSNLNPTRQIIKSDWVIL